MSDRVRRFEKEAYHKGAYEASMQLALSPRMTPPQVEVIHAMAWESWAVLRALGVFRPEPRKAQENHGATGPSTPEEGTR